MLAEMQLDPALLRLGSAQQHVLDVCSRMGLASLDATAFLNTAGTPSDLYNSDHIHLSVRGNQVVAKALAERLSPMLR